MNYIYVYLYDWHSIHIYDWESMSMIYIYFYLYDWHSIFYVWLGIYVYELYSC